MSTTGITPGAEPARRIDAPDKCPYCGSLDVRRSRRQGVWDHFVHMFNRDPYRCRRCLRRFYFGRLLPRVAVVVRIQLAGTAKPEPESEES